MRFVTPTGTAELFLVPFPSWPKTLRPQHLTVPADESAQVCTPPAMTFGGTAAAAGLAQLPPGIADPTTPPEATSRG